MLSKHTLELEKRERTGSRYAARVRAEGKLPAVVYGHKEEPVPVAIEEKIIMKYLHAGERIFSAKIDAGKEETVLVKDLQYDYLGTNVIHCDFERVDLDEQIESHVHIKHVGEAPGSKRAGAVFVHPMETLHVRCSVRNLPEDIEVDISELQAGEMIAVKDVTLPEGVIAIDAPERRVCAVTFTNADASANAEGEAVESEAAAPETTVQKSDDES
ncbi:MAG: 50S ribosomal protein L25 [Planctomycetota bacterium]